jgi:hypothetical protein
MAMIPPTSSLVKYENPALVTRNTDKRNAKVKYEINNNLVRKFKI